MKTNCPICEKNKRLLRFCVAAMYASPPFFVVLGLAPGLVLGFGGDKLLVSFAVSAAVGLFMSAGFSIVGVAAHVEIDSHLCKRLSK